ncbi:MULTISPECIES: CdaR family transcriptional regulator [unclassified Gordonia (in: high G+C Gram-positive bacteria)]|mgnify:CR=1 FL=1|uniref:PucR family transcriptional regulator n=1 Tax=unclassified Gordonia (in: high G+C Gram-positive bacteria) TaxID=2657482 RepID=UPI001F102086|nr:helix-turn-helix domain-containing protein [Gordonia sp. ABSL49_1]MCH5644405.1 helix-turn-helix domain-containing protein [Gordonia sp. ABSL49_1]
MSGSNAGQQARDRLAEVPMSANADVLEQVAIIAKQLRENEPELVADLSAMMAREIDQLDTDPKLVEMLGASVHGNVSTIIHVLANDIPVGHLQPTTAAVEYAMRLAQRDVPSNSLVRAYHLGQNSVMRLCYRMIEELSLDADMAMAVTRHVSDVIFGYIDWITLYVFQAYEDERRRWFGTEGNVLSSTIHQLLDSADPDERSFERETGYRLAQNHLAVILWTPDDKATDLRQLDRTARDMASRLLPEGPPVITAVDRSTIWMWVPLGSRARSVDAAEVMQRVRVPAATRIAIGLPAGDIRGFRRSHEQARAAYAIATLPGVSTPVVGFGDRGVAVVSMLAQDLETTRAWVREVLGSLSDDSPNAAMLRETLSVFLATKESHLHTAEQLNLHRNTVKYRIGKALAEIPSGRDRLDLAVALLVCEFLGPAVLA